MSERIAYDIQVLNVQRDSDAAKAVVEALEKFKEGLDDGEVVVDDTIDSPDKVDISICGDGWRGGSHTCLDIISRYINPVLQKFPDLKVEASATYLDHNPTEDFVVRDGKLTC